MEIFSSLQERYQILKGDSSTLTADAAGKSNLNWSVKDICNRFPFDWNLKSASLTLSSGVANLPTDFNAKWTPKDARIVVDSQDTDSIFTLIDIKNRDQFSTTDYVYWVTYDTSNGVYVFNTLTQAGTVVIYYYFTPVDLSADADKCIIPDAEAVAYLAVSKAWIGDERNAELQQVYLKEANDRIESLKQENEQITKSTLKGVKNGNIS